METVSLLRVLLAFAFVIGLMLAIAWGMRKFGLDRLRPKGGVGGGTLRIEESLYLDPKRRLVIVARGERKHLLLLGENADRVVESYDTLEH